MQELPASAYIMDSTRGVQPNLEAGFQAHEGDIILVTAPKAGTAWLKALMFSIIYRTQYPTSDPNHPCLTNNPHALVPHMNSVSSFTTSPRLFSSYFAYSLLPKSAQLSKRRIIYLFRNPKEVFVSMWCNVNLFSPRETIPLKEAFDGFCKGVAWFGPRWGHALEYRKKSVERPEEVLFLKYEDLKEDTASLLKQMAKYVGCPFSPKEERDGVIEGLIRVCSSERMSNFDVNESGERGFQWLENKDFLNKGVVGEWKNVLTPSMVKQLDKVMEQFNKNSAAVI